MKRILSSLLVLMGLSVTAQAQPAPSGLTGAYWTTGADCDAVTFTGPSGPRTLTVDSTGKLCVAAAVVVPPVTAVSAADAAATSPVTAPGVAKPMNESLFGELWVAPSLGGVPVSAAAPMPNGNYVYSGAAWEGVFSPFALADGVNGRDMVAVGSWLWNGATWDRQPGSAATGSKVQGAGTLGAAAGGVMTVQGGATGTPIPTTSDLTKVGGNNVASGGQNGSIGVGGLVATGAAVTLGNYPLIIGGRAATAEPSAVADGMVAPIKLTKTGKVVNSPWTIPEQYMRGKATVVITTPAALLAASGSASQFTYLVSMACGNSSATGVWATLDDSNATPIFIPATGGNNPRFDPPLVSSAANTAISIVGDSTQTTVKCSATGYKGL